jgi:hypothetical protein
VLPQREFEQLPVLLGQELARIAEQRYGFKVVCREDGTEVGDRLADYLVGFVTTAWNSVIERAGGSETRGTY